MRRIIILVFALCFFAGCTKSDKNSESSITMAITGAPKTLDPRFATDAYGQRIDNLLFNSLVRIGPDLKVVGDAAKSWEYKDLTYTFTLHPNLTFSNGAPLTEEDIRFTFEQYKNDRSPYRTALEPIAKVETDFTGPNPIVRLRLSKFHATLFSDLSPVKILPKAVVEKQGDDFGKNLVGTGSFELIKSTANEIELKARKNHAIVTPKTERVVFKIIRDDSTLFLKTLKGNLDIVQAEMPPNKVKEFEGKDDFQVYKYAGLSMTYLLINLKDPVLKNLNARQIIAKAVNRKEIIKYKLADLAMPATSILTPSNPFFHGDLMNLDYNLAEAKKAVQTNKLNGAPIILKTSNNPLAVENGKVIANQLNQAGLDIKLQSYEWGTYYGDIKSGNFQLAIMRWVGATDPDIYRIALHSKEQPPGRNRGHYSNPLLDTLVERGTTIENVSERISHYRKVQEIVMEDLPIVPLWYNVDVSIVNKKVKAYTPPKNGDFTPLLYVYK